MSTIKDEKSFQWTNESSILINAFVIALFVLAYKYVADSVLAVWCLEVLFLGLTRMLAPQVPVKWLFRISLVLLVACFFFGSSFSKKEKMAVSYVECAVIDKKWEKVGKGFYRDYYCSFVLCGSKKRSKLDLTDDAYNSLKVGDTIVVTYPSLKKVWKLDEWDFLGAHLCKRSDIVQKKSSYLYPVAFVNGQEYGSDYYYYAKLRPDLSLKNFGLNKLAIGKDSLLCYKNVNDSIDSQVHQCADSLQSQLNRDMLDTMDAFYFHGEIIPAEQVFAEIPQTRAYYERYNKKQTHSTR